MVTILVQLSSAKRLDAFRAGLGDTDLIVPVAMDEALFVDEPELDALYLSLGRAEKWGSKPGPPHRVDLLERPASEHAEGACRYILTGLVLRDGEPNTAEFCIPLIVSGIREALARGRPDRSVPIRTIGIPEFELTFPDASFVEVARLLRTALEAPSGG